MVVIPLAKEYGFVWMQSNFDEWLAREGLLNLLGFHQTEVIQDDYGSRWFTVELEAEPYHQNKIHDEITRALNLYQA